jgi:sugar lactone lactonase YvrE
MHLCSEDELLAGHASSGQERGESLDLNIVRLRMEEDTSEQHSQSDPGALSNSMDVVVVRPDGHVAWFGSAGHALGLLAQGLKVEHLLF